MKLIKILVGAAFFFGLAMEITGASQFVWKNIGISEVVMIDTDGEATIEEALSWNIWQPFEFPLYVGTFVAEDLVNYDDIGAPTAGAMITFDFARHFGWNAPPSSDKWEVGFNLEVGLIPISYDFEEEEIKFGIIASILKLEF
jgi:hypothetical protein